LFPILPGNKIELAAENGNGKERKNHEDTKNTKIADRRMAD
jgi:hypothetical protein